MGDVSVTGSCPEVGAQGLHLWRTHCVCLISRLVVGLSSRTNSHGPRTGQDSQHRPPAPPQRKGLRPLWSCLVSTAAEQILGLAGRGPASHPVPPPTQAESASWSQSETFLLVGAGQGRHSAAVWRESAVPGITTCPAPVGAEMQFATASFTSWHFPNMLLSAFYSLKIPMQKVSRTRESQYTYLVGCLVKSLLFRDVLSFIRGG